MRDGAFTTIVYQNNSVVGKEVLQEAMIIGPPIRTETKRKLCVIGDPGKNLYVNVPADGDEYAISSILKPIDSDQIVNTSDITFYLEDAKGENQLEMTSTNFKLGLDITSVSDYNTTVGEAGSTGDDPTGANKYLGTISIDHMLAIPFVHTTNSDLKATDLGSDLYDIEDSVAGTDDCLSKKINYIEKGYILVVNSANENDAIDSVDNDAGTITLETGAGAHFNATGGWASYSDGVNEYMFYYALVTTDTLSGCVGYHNEAGTFSASGTVTALAVARVTAVDKANKKITVYSESDLDTFETASELNTWEIYKDYTGIMKGTPSSYSAAHPKVKMSIIANRPSVQGRYTISQLSDLTTLFGEDAVTNNLSHLAFDAAVFFTFSQTKFYIYAMDVDTTTATYGEANAVSTTEVATAISAIERYKAYHIVPSYRFDEAGDKANVLAVLALYKAAVISRTSTAKRNEGHLWAAMPLLNKGYGYCDASAVGGVDLSAVTEGTDFFDTTCDADDDYDAVVGIPGNSFNSELVTLTPAYAKVGTQVLPASAVAAAFAGNRASKELGYSTTYDTLGAITSVPSVEYFSPDQIEGLKSAGWQLLVQENSSSVPIIYHETTTETDILEKREESLTIAFHACAAEIRANIQPFIARGVANRMSSDPTAPVTLSTLRTLNMAVASVRTKYLTQRILSNIEILGVTQNESNPDQSDIQVKLTPYYPHNRANITIFI